MNKYQEAFEHALSLDGGTLADYELIKELVDKETPKKPKKLKLPALLDSPIYATHKCECGYLLIRDTYENYCAQCGKKIDWCRDEL